MWRFATWSVETDVSKDRNVFTIKDQEAQEEKHRGLRWVYVFFLTISRQDFNGLYVRIVAQSVLRLATGWTVRGSNSGGGKFFAHVQTGPEAHPASCTVGTGSFPG
jgi:hypothetical protein